MELGSNLQLEWPSSEHGYGNKIVPLLGKLFLLQIVAVYIVDWWFPYDPMGPPRFWPRVIRALFVSQLIAYLSLHLKRTWRFPVAKAQIAWASVLLIRFAFQGNFQNQLLLYMSYYFYWVLILWTAYSLVIDGHLTSRQVAYIGAITNLILLFRMALFDFAGIWIGNPGSLNDAKGSIANAAYPMLYFTLMQLQGKKFPLSRPIIFITLAGIVISLKRGALVGLLLGALVYGVTYAYLNRKNHGIRRVLAIGAIAAVVVGITAFLQGGQLTERWTEIGDDPLGAGSGRAMFWVFILLHWLKGDFLTKLIGFGPHSTYDVTGDQWLAQIPAHNDWLQMLHEFGVIGLLAFAWICVVLVKKTGRIMRIRPDMASAYCAALAAAFCVTIFDLFSYNTETSFFALMVAVPLGLTATAREAVLGRRVLERAGSATRQAIIPEASG